jgi:hypothetical protein
MNCCIYHIRARNGKLVQVVTLMKKSGRAGLPVGLFMKYGGCVQVWVPAVMSTISSFTSYMLFGKYTELALSSK